MGDEGLDEWVKPRATRSNPAQALSPKLGHVSHNPGVQLGGVLGRRADAPNLNIYYL